MCNLASYPLFCVQAVQSTRLASVLANSSVLEYCMDTMTSSTVAESLLLTTVTLTGAIVGQAGEVRAKDEASQLNSKTSLQLVRVRALVRRWTIVAAPCASVQSDLRTTHGCCALCRSRPRRYRTSCDTAITQYAWPLLELLASFCFTPALWTAQLTTKAGTKVNLPRDTTGCFHGQSLLGFSTFSFHAQAAAAAAAQPQQQRQLLLLQRRNNKRPPSGYLHWRSTCA